MMPRALSLPALLAAMAIACGDNSTNPEPVPTGIRFISETGFSDTTGKILNEPLIVEVRDTLGRLAPLGTAVRFAALSLDNVMSPYDPQVEAYVHGIAETEFRDVSAATTDRLGRAVVYVKLGYRAGQARVVVSAPTLRVIDTASYTILPGAATQLGVSPGDSTLYVGEAYPLAGRVKDAYGNVRNDPVTWSTTASGLTVDAATGLVTASAFGRHSIRAVSGTLEKSVSVSVVPQGRIVAVDLNESSNLIAFNLNGTNRKTLAYSVYHGGVGLYVSWIPNTNLVVYTNFEDGFQVLRTVDEAGTSNFFFTSPPPQVSHQADPVASANGNWVYFSAYDSRCSSVNYCLYRARSDATDPELLGSFIAHGEMTRHPAPSPDGSKVAFVSGGSSITGDNAIRIFDVATRVVSSLIAQGSHPRWSPTGEQIAYISSGKRLSLVNPDGSGNRAVNGKSYGGPIAWSPDGQWILAGVSGPLELVHVATGTTIPLPYSISMAAPSWK